MARSVTLCRHFPTSFVCDKFPYTMRHGQPYPTGETRCFSTEVTFLFKVFLQVIVALEQNISLKLTGLCKSLFYREISLGILSSKINP